MLCRLAALFKGEGNKVAVPRIPSLQLVFILPLYPPQQMLSLRDAAFLTNSNHVLNVLE